MVTKYSSLSQSDPAPIQHAHDIVPGSFIIYDAPLQLPLEVHMIMYQNNLYRR